MTPALFDLPAPPLIPVQGAAAGYPVRRIFCVGRNYAAHAAEMGTEADREAPFYFTKSPAALMLSGGTLAYPPGTANCHHEMELVVSLGAPAFRASRAAAAAAVHGYACGLDMTRRDLQQAARVQQRPWDIGKDFEGAAVIAGITPAAALPDLAPRRITLEVNGTLRQEATLAELIHDVPAIIAHLSGFYHLGPGDLIMTGTPAGVGPVAPGDRLTGRIDGLAPVELTIGDPE